MNILQINPMDVGNGPGFRCSVFVAGCSLQCKGCWNPESWDPQGGEPLTDQHIDAILDAVSHPMCAGLSLLGGDPFYGDNFKYLLPIVKKIREIHGKSKTIWCWSGYRLEYLCKDPEKLLLLREIDTLIDGPFILSKRDLTLNYRGSSNQRVLYNLQEMMSFDNKG